MKNLATRALCAVVILTIAIPCLPLFAQETTPEDQPKLTEEMVVTAREREETIQEVPISVAAPTGIAAPISIAPLTACISGDARRPCERTDPPSCPVSAACGCWAASLLAGSLGVGSVGYGALGLSLRAPLSGSDRSRPPLADRNRAVTKGVLPTLGFRPCLTSATLLDQNLT